MSHPACLEPAISHTLTAAVAPTASVLLDSPATVERAIGPTGRDGAAQRATAAGSPKPSSAPISIRRLPGTTLQIDGAPAVDHGKQNDINPLFPR